MSAQKETSLLMAAREGDKVALEALLLQFDPLRRTMAARYLAHAAQSAEYDDFYQEATIAFLGAVRTYDISQTEVTFGLYAKICMRNRLISKLRAWKRPISPEQEAQTMADPAEQMVCEERYQTLLSQIACLLSKREMDVFRLYLLGKSYSDISLALGISEKSVDNALFRMKAKLKKVGIAL